MGLEEFLHNAELLFRTDTVYQIAWVFLFIIIGLYVFYMRRFIRSRPHVHEWKDVVHMGFKGGGFEADQVCECRARRKVEYWPPPEYKE